MGTDSSRIASSFCYCAFSARRPMSVFVFVCEGDVSSSRASGWNGPSSAVATISATGLVASWLPLARFPAEWHGVAENRHSVFVLIRADLLERIVDLGIAREVALCAGIAERRNGHRSYARVPLA